MNLLKISQKTKISILCFLLSVFCFLFSAQADEYSPAQVLFFYSTGCGHCLEIKNGLLQKMGEKYAGNIEIKHFETGEKENYELLIALEKEYGIKQSKNPTIFINEYVLNGAKEIERNLEQTIERYLSNGADFSTAQKIEEITIERIAENKNKKDVIIERFKSFSLLTIIGAGLIDGINPCAFTVIVFFISFLAFSGYKKEKLGWVGFSFILAVFLTYLGLGLGIFKFLQKLQIFYTLSQVIYSATAILAIGLGCLAVYDYCKYKSSGKTEGLKLQLPPFIKKITHRVIREGVNKKEGLFKIVISAFVIGFLISLLEAVCTGQVYLPTIVLVSKIPSLKSRALFYLILYNLMFVIPLIAIFLLAYKGFTSQQFSKFASYHLGKIKLMMAILFFCLGTGLFIFR
ncbi:MAG: hypothetical protein KAS87_00820 [Candidatus Omnitrophica bacterium]|nr:hypothetical protein [Candidatus Omnitrophota bacterium]